MGKNKYNQYQLVIYIQLLDKIKGPKKKKKNQYKWKIPNVCFIDSSFPLSQENLGFVCVFKFSHLLQSKLHYPLFGLEERGEKGKQWRERKPTPLFG